MLLLFLFALIHLIVMIVITSIIITVRVIFFRTFVPVSTLGLFIVTLLVPRRFLPSTGFLCRLAFVLLALPAVLVAVQAGEGVVVAVVPARPDFLRLFDLFCEAFRDLLDVDDGWVSPADELGGYDYL